MHATSSPTVGRRIPPAGMGISRSQVVGTIARTLRHHRITIVTLTQIGTGTYLPMVQGGTGLADIGETGFTDPLTIAVGGSVGKIGVVTPCLIHIGDGPA